MRYICIYLFVYLSIYLYMNILHECLEINCGFCYMIFEISCNLILIYLIEIKNCSSFL